MPELPLVLDTATLVAGRLEFRLRTARAGLVVRSARLLGPTGAATVEVAGPGLLRCPVPPAGGRLILSIESVEPHDEAFPAMPWEYPLFLPDSAVTDYRSAAPCGAVLTLPYGEALLVDRVLRRMGRTLVYADWRVTGSGHRWWPPAEVSLLAGARTYTEGEHPYQYGAPDHPGDTPVQVQVFCFQGVPLDPSLTLVIRKLALHVPGDWHMDLVLPPGRPAAMPVDQTVPVGNMVLTLVEAWFGLTRSALVFESSASAQPDIRTLSLVDSSGRQYRPGGNTFSNGQLECRFEAVPSGPAHLRVNGEGLILHLKDDLSLPLTVGGRAHAPLPSAGTPHRYTVSSDWFPVLMPAAAPRPSRPAAPAARDEVRSWIQQHLVPAARLQFRRTPPANLNPASSHLGGPVLLPADEPWPACGRCQKPLSHVGQIRSDPGLLTFFYCFRCRPVGPEGAAAYRIWLLEAPDSALVAQAPPDAAAPVPAPCAIELTQVNSAPQWDDARPDLEHLDLGSDPWEAYHDVWSDLTGATTLESRLGGFPDWIQGARWPQCPVCGQRMTLLLQLDSEPATGLMWGDSGRLFLFRCPGPGHAPEMALILQSC